MTTAGYAVIAFAVMWVGCDSGRATVEPAAAPAVVRTEDADASAPAPDAAPVVEVDWHRKTDAELLQAYRTATTETEREAIMKVYNSGGRVNARFHAQHDNPDRQKAARAASEAAEKKRLKGRKPTKECLDNPLAKDCM